MSLRADRYRQRADDAKHRASQAKDPSIKSAFEHVAAGWVALAEQVERIDTEKFSLREEENNHSVRFLCASSGPDQIGLKPSFFTDDQFC